MTDNLLKLFCIVNGDSKPFPVNIDASETVGDLQDIIKKRKASRLDHVASDELTLWGVSIPIVPAKDSKPISLDNHKRDLLEVAEDLTDVFEHKPPKKTIRVIVQLSAQAYSTYLAGSLSQSVRPILSGDLQADVNEIASRFFAAGSPASNFLNAYVRGEFKLPTTTRGIKGLSRVNRRGPRANLESRPSFLFFDLPVPPSRKDDIIPERFRSNVLLQRLQVMESQDLPLFGVSGCGKTRLVIETPCLQWGFYFNAAIADLGSNDLSELADVIDFEGADLQDPALRADFAREMTMVLFFSRFLVLRYCLQVPSCRQTFSSASWAVLQVCPHIFRDVFSDLFFKLCLKLKGFTIPGSALTSILQNELVAVRDILVARNYPNFSSESKWRLFVDEAKVLSHGKLNYQSYGNRDLQPMLSPVLYGFRKAGGPNELTITYCGTGLSITTPQWALSSGDGVKEGQDQLPYIEFPGWAGPDSVHAFIGRVKEHLPDDESRKLLDLILPPAAVDYLHEKLTGRFRPIVTAIEGIISELEAKFNKHRGGNFKGMSCIRETLEVFLYRYYLLDETEIALEDGLGLVEAAFGRIKLFGGAARTVVDEPFGLKAAKTFFENSDPLFFSAFERAVQFSTNATVHGNVWEPIMASVFIETFRTRPLSSWPLLGNNTLPQSLAGDVTVVGYIKKSKPAISHKSITTHAFMDAHIKNGSKRGDQNVPPFYFPAPRISGPDIVFFVKIKGNVYPVFVQLKLRQVLEGSDAQKALATVSSSTMQGKMDKEHERLAKDQASTQPPRLQDYCPTGVYVSMVIVYPAEVVKFQAHRPDPEPELQGLERVSINIDNTNFAKIFPLRHVEFLNKFKQDKRTATGHKATRPS